MLNIVVILVVAVLLWAILHPLTHKAVSSAHDGMAYGFMKDIGHAIQAYADQHNGVPPPSLDALYPHYFRDKQILQPIIVDYGGFKMAVTYWRPKRLGDPDTPVAEIRPVPSHNAKRHVHGWVLWGNLHIEPPKR